MNEDELMGEAWDLILKIHEQSGMPPLNQVPGCYEVELVDGWTMALNGHHEATPSKLIEGNFAVAPYHCCGIRDGFPWINMRPQDGITVGRGSLEAFVGALRKAVLR